MKFTIIPDDNFVSKDGVGYSNLTFEIGSDIHAVQWYGNFGEIEYKNTILNGNIVKPQNVGIIEYEQFQPALLAWKVADDLVPPSIESEA